jgi:hypothetical protein
MTGILDRVAKSYASFIPRDQLEYFAFQVARTFGDEMVVGLYVSLAHAHPQDRVAAAVRLLGPASSVLRPALVLDAQLKTGRLPLRQELPKVLGIRIERRAIGVVLFNRGMIAYVQTLELSSTGSEAVRSIEALMPKLLPRIGQATVAIERIVSTEESRRKELTEVTLGLLRNAGVSIWEVDRSDLLLSSATPPPKNLQGIREIGASFWPTLAGAGARSDILLAAAMTALYVHAHRQLRREDREAG